jgi:type III secretory pathway component EscU
MDTVSAIQLATILAGGVTSSVIVQLVKRYIISEWRLPFSLALSAVISVVALWLTGGFVSPTSAAVIIAAIMGVAQTVYAIIAKAYVDLDTSPVSVTATPQPVVVSSTTAPVTVDEKALSATQASTTA